MYYWLVVGPPENWETAFNQGNIWGLINKQKHWWDKLNEGDTVLFYATKPVSGLIGYGTIKTKFRQDKPLWPQEVSEGIIRWPLRFEFSVSHCIVPDEWNTRKITSDALKLKAGIGFHTLEPEFAQQMISTLEPVPPPSAEQALSLHEEIKQRLVEIGRLQDYLAEPEYSFDIGKIDVVWRRVTNSVPTYAFEIQVGGDVYHALAKLKHAFDLWNSHIFIVASNAEKRKVESLLLGTFHEINNRIRFIELEQIMELYRRKKDYLDFEKELGI